MVNYSEGSQHPQYGKIRDPNLDEGDFVIQPILKTGTSLSGTIERTTQIEKILLDNLCMTFRTSKLIPGCQELVGIITYVFHVQNKSLNFLFL